jgi:hypothetical protein
MASGQFLWLLTIKCLHVYISTIFNQKFNNLIIYLLLTFTYANVARAKDMQQSVTPLLINNPVNVRASPHQ